MCGFPWLKDLVRIESTNIAETKTAGTDEQYPMSEAHDTGEEPVLTGYVSSVPHRPVGVGLGQRPEGCHLIADEDHFLRGWGGGGGSGSDKE